MTPRAPMVAATHYFLAKTAKNMGLHVLRGLRSPRNVLAVAVAALFGLFIWFMMSKAGAQASAGLAEGFRERVAVLHLIAIFVWFDVLFRCVGLPFGGGVATLARLLGFKRADVELLFQAPVTRRQIVYFKVVRVLCQVVAGAVVYAVLMALLYPPVSFIRAFMGLVVGVFAIQMLYFAMHLCASFLASKSLRGVVLLFSAAVVALFSFGVIQAFTQAHSSFGELSRVAETQAFQALVFPLVFVFEPAAAASWLQFVKTIWQPLLVGVAMGAVFFTRRFRFEYFAEAFGNRESESSLEAAQPPVPARRAGLSFLRLRRVGPQWRAIAWKNLKSCAPSSSRSALVQVSVVVLVVMALCLAPISEGYQIIVSTLLHALILSSVVVGPWVMRRGGLRSDMSYFDLLKSMPLSGRQLLFGEVIVQFAMIGSVVLLAVAILAMRQREPSVGLLIALLGLIAARVTLHNLFALYFPGLVKLDPTGSENDHRVLVRAAVSLLAFVALLIVPVLVAGGISMAGAGMWQLDRAALGSLASATIGIVLVLELFVLIYFSESRYRRFDISRENTAQ